MKITFKHLLISTFAVTAMAGAHAQSQSGWYAGGSVGKSQIKTDATYLPNEVTDTSSTGYKLFAGYQFTPNFALEGQYQDLGKYTDSYAPLSYTSELKVRGLSFAAVGILPVGQSFSLFAKAGFAVQNFRSEERLGSTSDSASETRTRPLIGVGAEYQITPALSLRGEYEYFAATSFDSGVKVKPRLLSAGIRYRF